LAGAAALPLADLVAVVFLAPLAAVFFDGVFWAVGFLGAAFVAVGFLAAGSLAEAFLTGGFYAAGFLAVGFLAAGFAADAVEASADPVARIGADPGRPSHVGGRPRV
jgi:hypothetical protein